MASIPQIRNRLLEGFSEKQADLLAHVVIEAHDDVVNRADFHALTGVVKELADAQKRTEERVEELVDAQKRTEERVEELADAQKRTEERVEELADAQKRTEERVEELADAQKRTEKLVEELAGAQKRTEERVEELVDAQKRTEELVEELAGAQNRTEDTLGKVVSTQQKMLIRLDRLDGHMLEDKVARNLPAFLGREFRKCRVLDRAEFVEGLGDRLPEETLVDLMRADVIAIARRAEQAVHIVVEVSCTADTEDLDRALRRTKALGQIGLTAIGIVACEVISPQTLAAAHGQGLRVLANGWLLPEAA